MTAAILLGLRGAVRNAGWSLKERATAFLVVALTFIGWLGHLTREFKATPFDVP